MSTAEDTMLTILDQVKQDISIYSYQDKIDIVAHIKDEILEINKIAEEIIEIL